MRMAAPQALARLTSSGISLTHPSTLETWVTATIRVCSENAASIFSLVIVPSGSHSRKTSFAPVARETICHGKMLL